MEKYFAKMTNIPHKSDRLQWMDITHGLRILLVVMGHNPACASGTLAKPLLFSFHIPLFFSSRDTFTTRARHWFRPAAEGQTIARPARTYRAAFISAIRPCRILRPSISGTRVSSFVKLSGEPEGAPDQLSVLAARMVTHIAFYYPILLLSLIVQNGESQGADASDNLYRIVISRHSPSPLLGS